MLKRFAALITALVISSAVLTGCSGNKDSSSSQAAESSSSEAASAADTSSAADASETGGVPEPGLVIDGEKIDTEGLIICTVDGRDVDFDTFRYYYYSTLYQLQNTYGVTLDALKQTETGFDMLLEATITSIKQDFVFYRFCADNGLTLSEEELQANEETYNNLLEQAGSEEAMLEMLANAYMTEDVYRAVLESAAYCVKCEELFSNGGVYATSKEEFRSIVQDPEKFAAALSILIPYSCKAEITDDTVKSEYDGYSLQEKYNAKEDAYNALDSEAQEAAKAQAKALADEVAAKAADGSDFEALISEYGWDPGMENNSDGYYVTPETNFVSEYLDALFALGEGEVSGVVENEVYGWFIIKRVPIDMDYIEDNIDNMIVEYDMPKRQQIYSDTLDNMEVVYTDIYKSLTIDSIS